MVVFQDNGCQCLGEWSPSYIFPGHPPMPEGGHCLTDTNIQDIQIQIQYGGRWCTPKKNIQIQIYKYKICRHSFYEGGGFLGGWRRKEREFGWRNIWETYLPSVNEEALAHPWSKELGRYLEDIGLPSLNEEWPIVRLLGGYDWGLPPSLNEEDKIE